MQYGFILRVQHKSSVGGYSLKICNSDFAQICSSGAIQNLSRLENADKGRADITSGKGSPAQKMQFICIHVITSDEKLIRIILSINLFFNLAHQIAK